MTEFIHSALVFLGAVGIRDIVDIVIVAVLLYQLFKLIRGTQAVQLLVGLAVLLVIGLLAQAFQLRLLQFIFANAGTAILIGVIVLFQPELRRALDQVGRLGTVGFILGRHTQPVARTVEAGIRAAATLAEALPGVGRMGTRHRAALGLTLQSDAVILIVSEETGLISLAYAGKLYRGLDHDKLQEMLTTLVLRPVTRRTGAGIRPLVRSGAALRALGRRNP